VVRRPARNVRPRVGRRRTISKQGEVAITILVDERADGVHLSYDSMASLLAPYGSQAALLVARDLDTKIEGLLETAARRVEDRTTARLVDTQRRFASPTIQSADDTIVQ
jgi:hypothetical protein